jgi:pimeloyl-ACP methyl ester carboxylesterase
MKPIRHAHLPARWTRRGAGLIAAAAVLGAAALHVRSRARRAERRHPPVGRFLTVEGVRLHYLERGQGHAVVLLHGTGSMIPELMTSGIVEDLARSCRVIAFDRPGFGYSSRPRLRLWTPSVQADLIAGALAQLGVREAVVYGHSLGTQVAVSLALSNPGLVRGLVLGSGYYYPTARADVPLTTPPALPVIGDVLRYTVTPALVKLLLPRIYAKVFGPTPIPERFQREFPHDLLIRPRHLRAAAEDTAFLIPAAAATREHDASLAMPVTLITGDSDRVVEPARQTRRLHSELAGSRLVVVPGAGHMIQQAAPDEVVSAIQTLADHVLARTGPAEEAQRPSAAAPDPLTSGRARHSGSGAPANAQLKPER